MGKQIESDKDLDDLIYFLLPSRMKGEFKRNPSSSKAKHRVVTILNTLWNKNNPISVGIGALIKLLIERNNWKPGSRNNRELSRSELKKLQIKDFRKIINRSINGVIKDSGWKEYAHIIYDKTNRTLRLSLDKAEIYDIFHPKSSDGIIIHFPKCRCDNGVYILAANKPLKFKITSPISGYVHLFSINSSGKYIKLYPHEKAKYIRIVKNRTISFPDSFFLGCKKWELESPDDKDGRLHKIIAVVTTIDVDINRKELHTLGILDKIRSPNYIPFTFDDLNSKLYLHNTVYYRLK